MNLPGVVLNREDIAVELHVRGHGVVDVIAKGLGDGGGFLGQFLRVVGERPVTAAVVFLGCLAGCVQIVRQ
jgi:hypothetical protein